MSAPKPVQALFKWTPSGLGVFLTGHYLLNQDVVQTALAAFFTGLTALWVKFSDGFMKEAEQQAEKAGGSLAQWMFALLGTLGAAVKKRTTQLWWELTSDFEGKYYKRLEYVCRRFQTQGLEADKDRVLNLQQVFVLVQICQRSLARTSPNLLRRLEEREESFRGKDIGDFLALMGHEPDFRRLAILGAPGSGKTTMMRYLTLMYAARTPRKLHPNAPQFIPVLLYLRDVYPTILQKPDLPLADLITDWAKKLQTTDPLKPPTGWFAKKLSQNRCLILLDGLDEVADESQRQQISRWVDRQMYEYPDTPFILTSRPLGYEKAQLQEDVMVLEVESMTTEQIHTFVRNWYLATEVKSQGGEVDLGIREEAEQQANRLIAEIDRQPALAEMASNPLLLTMIATVHRRRASLPLNRVELYREICQVLLEKRQRAKGMTDVLTADQKQSVLQPLALDLTQRNTLKFTLAEVRPLLQAKLATLPGLDWTPEQFLKQLREVDALIAKEQEDVFEFAHRSFQEYLTATEIKETNQEALLIEALNDSESLEWWADTMRLYAAQTDTSNLIDAVLRQQAPSPEPSLDMLLLAIDFWQMGRTVQPASKKALLTKITQPLTVLDEPTLNWAKPVQPRYFKLAYYLQKGEWREADLETYEVMVAVSDRDQERILNVTDIQQFPCEDLRIIDQLWVKHSQGKFGFSVQKQIYVETDKPLDGKYHEGTWESFCDRVGWRKAGRWDLNVWDFKIKANLSLGGLPFIWFFAGVPYAFDEEAGVAVAGAAVGSLFSRAKNCEL
ncbi:MAG: GUN4 domain-containing protein [Nodosilinea sp.]